MNIKLLEKIKKLPPSAPLTRHRQPRLPWCRASGAGAWCLTTPEHAPQQAPSSPERDSQAGLRGPWRAWEPPRLRLQSASPAGASQQTISNQLFGLHFCQLCISSSPRKTPSGCPPASQECLVVSALSPQAPCGLWHAHSPGLPSVPGDAPGRAPHWRQEAVGCRERPAVEALTQWLPQPRGWESLRPQTGIQGRPHCPLGSQAPPLSARQPISSPPAPGSWIPTPDCNR